MKHIDTGEWNPQTQHGKTEHRQLITIVLL